MNDSTKPINITKGVIPANVLSNEEFAKRIENFESFIKTSGQEILDGTYVKKH